jgi:hypothetical protein
MGLKDYTSAERKFFRRLKIPRLKTLEEEDMARQSKKLKYWNVKELGAATEMQFNCAEHAIQTLKNKHEGEETFVSDLSPTSHIFYVDAEAKYLIRQVTLVIWKRAVGVFGSYDHDSAEGARAGSDREV